METLPEGFIRLKNGELAQYMGRTNNHGHSIEEYITHSGGIKL